MEKKVYFNIDNGDTCITVGLTGVLSLLAAEMAEVRPSEDDIELYAWDIRPILLTEEEFNALPEAESE